jgi:YfiH family protein
MKLQSSLLAAIPDLNHAFFTRDGGVSEGIYQSLNGGLGSNDHPAHIAENRRRMAEAVGVGPGHFLSVHQTHSADVAVASGPWPDGARPRADAIVTRTEGLAIGATAADCGAVLLVDPSARVIGAAHAGWKGALAGILRATVDAMVELGAERGAIIAAIGPLIRQPSYEVGDEFVERFVAASADNSEFFRPASRAGHAMFDLAGFIRHRLRRAGVSVVDDSGLDTYSDPRFFSYRRSVHRGEPDYGRHIHAITLTQLSIFRKGSR